MQALSCRPPQVQGTRGPWGRQHLPSPQPKKQMHQKWYKDEKLNLFLNYKCLHNKLNLAHNLTSLKLSYRLSGAVNCEFFTVSFFYFPIYPGIIWILHPDMRPYSYFDWSSLHINHIITINCTIETGNLSNENQREMNFSKKQSFFVFSSIERGTLFIALLNM